MWGCLEICRCGSTCRCRGRRSRTSRQTRQASWVQQNCCYKVVQ